MLRRLGLILLGLLLFACFTPFYSVFIIYPVTLLVTSLIGEHAWLFPLEMVLIYALSAATSAWVVSRLWTPKRPRLSDAEASTD